MHTILSHAVGLVLVAGLTMTSSAAFGQAINEDVKFAAEDSEFGDQLGWSIDVDDGIIAISTYTSNNDYKNISGKAYLFDAKTGEQLHKLLPNDGLVGDGFGWSIAIDDGIVAVGAPLNGAIDTAVGAAYLFDAATGVQLHKLISDDPESYSYLGLSIALDDGIVAVGAPYQYDDVTMTYGGVYLFDAKTGTQISKIIAEDSNIFGEFGSVIAMHNGVIAITNTNDANNGPQTGAAYLFDIATGAQIVKFYPDDPEPRDYFGQSVDINDGFVAVDQYLFDTATGQQLMKLRPNDWPKKRDFGGRPSVNNGIIAIASNQGRGNGEQSGAAYLFDIATGNQIAKLLPEVSTPYGGFGHSVAMDRGTLAVGAVYTDGTGAGYAFDLSRLTCRADLTGDGSIDFFDIAEFVSGQIDWNGDTAFDLADLTEFIASYTAGCP